MCSLIPLCSSSSFLVIHSFGKTGKTCPLLWTAAVVTLLLDALSMLYCLPPSRLMTHNYLLHIMRKAQYLRSGHSSMQPRQSVSMLNDTWGPALFPLKSTVNSLTLPSCGFPNCSTKKNACWSLWQHYLHNERVQIQFYLGLRSEYPVLIHADLNWALWTSLFSAAHMRLNLLQYPWDRQALSCRTEISAAVPHCCRLLGVTSSPTDSCVPWPLSGGHILQ